MKKVESDSRQDRERKNGRGHIKRENKHEWGKVYE